MIPVLVLLSALQLSSGMLLEAESRASNASDKIKGLKTALLQQFDDSDKLYAMIITGPKSAGPQYNISVGLSESAFQSKITSMRLQQWYVNDLSVARLYGAGQSLQYSATFTYIPANPYPPNIFLDYTAANYQNLFNQVTKSGYRLRHIRCAPCVSAWDANGVQRDDICYSGYFDQSPAPGAWLAYHGVTSGQHQTNFNTYTSQGYRLVDVCGALGLHSNQDFYAALYIKYATAPSSGWVAFHGLDTTGLVNEINIWRAKGFRLIHLTGYRSWNAAEYLWDKAFAIIMDNSPLPLGVTKWDRIANIDQTVIQSQLQIESNLNWEITQISEY